MRTHENTHRDPFAAVAALVVLLSAPATAGEETGVIPFTPPGSEGAGGPAIELVFQGKVYDPPAWLSEVDASGHALTPDEDFLVRVVTANQSGSPERIVPLWAPDERSEIAAMADDPDELEKNLSYYRALKDTALLARLEYGPYVIFVVRHSGELFDDFIHVYPMIREGRDLWMTNRLQDDPLLHFLFFVYGQRNLGELDEESTEVVSSEEASHE